MYKRQDYEVAYYGMYFLEVCDYCTRENNDERELLKLLYQSLRAPVSYTHLDVYKRQVRRSVFFPVLFFPLSANADYDS